MQVGPQIFFRIAGVEISGVPAVVRIRLITQIDAVAVPPAVQFIVSKIGTVDGLIGVVSRRRHLASSGVIVVSRLHVIETALVVVVSSG